MLQRLCIICFLISALNNMGIYCKYDKVEHTILVRSPSGRVIQTFHCLNMSFTHAESPVWDPDIGTLFFVDVLEQNIHALDYKSKKLRTKHIEYGEVNIVLPIKNNTRLLVTVRSQVFVLDFNKCGDAAIRLVTAVEMGKPNHVINEGKADKMGRFWVGTKGPQLGNEVSADEAKFYSMQYPDFTPEIQITPVSISNGLVWSLNNSLLYYIDSNTHKIEAFNFDVEKGKINNRRTILDIRSYGLNDNAIADGMTIDKEGQLWVAVMFNGSVIRIDPDARTITQRYQLPVSHVSSVAWAGDDMCDLVITTSRRNMEPEALAAEPYAGRIFILPHLSPCGVPDHKLYFPGADTY